MDDSLKDAVEQGCEAFRPERDFDRGEGRQPGYLQFTDLEGDRVRVVPSSAAMRHALRIFIDPPPERTAPQPTPGGMVHPAERPASMHLCRGMAWELVYALQRMLAEPVDPELACEWTVYPPDGVTRVVESGGSSWRAVCACGEVLGGGTHVMGDTRYGHLGAASFQSSITVWVSDPENTRAVQHLVACDAHLHQSPVRMTVVRYQGRPNRYFKGLL